MVFNLAQKAIVAHSTWPRGGLGGGLPSTAPQYESSKTWSPCRTSIEMVQEAQWHPALLSNHCRATAWLQRITDVPARPGPLPWGHVGHPWLPTWRLSFGYWILANHSGCSCGTAWLHFWVIQMQAFCCNCPMAFRWGSLNLWRHLLLGQHTRALCPKRYHFKTVWTHGRAPRTILKSYSH